MRKSQAVAPIGSWALSSVSHAASVCFCRTIRSKATTSSGSSVGDTSASARLLALGSANVLDEIVMAVQWTTARRKAPLQG